MRGKSQEINFGRLLTHEEIISLIGYLGRSGCGCFLSAEAITDMSAISEQHSSLPELCQSHHCAARLIFFYLFFKCWGCIQASKVFFFSECSPIFLFPVKGLCQKGYFYEFLLIREKRKFTFRSNHFRNTWQILKYFLIKVYSKGPISCKINCLTFSVYYNVNLSWKSTQK